MKKILIYAIFLAFGLSLQAQNLYVQVIGANEQIAFSLADKPTITFDETNKYIQMPNGKQTFPRDTIQSMSFRSNQEASIEVKLDEGKISIFPNPVKSELTITLDISTQGLMYRIFDLSGRQAKVDRIYSAETRVQMQNFRAGTYILRIERSGHLIQSFKIIKQ